MHLGGDDLCTADECNTAWPEQSCWEYAPVVLPEEGERPVFGVHRLAPQDAWAPEQLGEYWSQDE
jgi:hypothetical protein